MLSGSSPAPARGGARSARRPRRPLGTARAVRAAVVLTAASCAGGVHEADRGAQLSLPSNARRPDTASASAAPPTAASPPEAPQGHGGGSSGPSQASLSPPSLLVAGPPADLVGACLVSPPVAIGTADRPLRNTPRVLVAANAERVMVLWSGRTQAGADGELRARVLDLEGRPSHAEQSLAIRHTGRLALAPLSTARFAAAVVLSERPRDRLVGSWPMAISVAPDGVMTSADDVGAQHPGDLPGLHAVTPTPTGVTMLASDWTGNHSVVQIREDPGGRLDVTVDAIPEARSKRSSELTLSVDDRGQYALVWPDGARVTVRTGGAPARTFVVPEEGAAIARFLGAPFTVAALESRTAVLLTRTSWSGASVPSLRFDVDTGAVTVTAARPEVFGLDTMTTFRLVAARHPRRGLDLYRSGAPGTTPLLDVPVEAAFGAVTWTGARFVAAYPLIHANTWTIFAQSIICDPAADATP